MHRATSYEQWKKAARAEDRRTGADSWRAQDRTRLYDYKIIRRRYLELVQIRKSGDAQRLLYYLNEGLHGNMGGMGAPALYARAHSGTKKLITRYVDELVLALHDLEDVDEREIDFLEKLAFLRRARDCFGRSALMLSGAGSLGAFHFGVAKALTEQQLVPNVISGASAGSVVAAMIGTRQPQDLESVFSTGGVASSFESLGGPGRGAGGRRRIRIENLTAAIEAAIPDMTFIEALEETGRQINVSVAPATLHQRSRLLNASTSPNAFIREAVLASCAVPGVFPPVTLAARDSSGARRPYVPSRQWVDGSITDDLPARRLARLYGVNHFISSQANPIALLGFQDPHSPGGLLPRLGGVYASASQELLRAVFPFAMAAVRNWHPVNTYTRLWFSVLTQDYTADVNIAPRQRFFDPRMLLAALSTQEAEALLDEGERATWPKIEIIRNCTEVSRCIDTLLIRMEEREPRLTAVRA